jgi:hypothetical protein
MAYGGSGIPHHEVGDRGSRARRILGRCNGVGHWVSWGGNLGKCDKRQVTSGQTRKGTDSLGLDGWPTGKDKRGGATLSGKKKTPQA